MSRSTVLVMSVLASLVIRTAAQPPGAHPAPRLWTDDALAGWALPIAGVNATPNFYSEAEYYAAPVDELRTYPVYVRNKEPKGYREGLRRRGPQPLIALGRARTDAEWAAAGKELFSGLDLSDNRTDNPAVIAWVDDPSKAADERALITKDGVIVGLRWVVDRDGKLKITLSECGACHTRVLPDGTEILGAQGNLRFRLSVFGAVVAQAEEARKKTGHSVPPGDELYAEYGVPWLPDDVNARVKSMTEEQMQASFRLDAPGTFPRFNGSPWFTNHMPDLIGVKDRRYLDATATHRNRGAEDIARYAILVTDADDGSIGPHRFRSDEYRRLRSRHSDDAMYAIGRFVYAAQPPKNPNLPDELSARGEQVFTQSGCAGCHTPPLYTNNKLVPVDRFARLDHPQSPPPADILVGARLGLDAGLALKTRKGTGYYKVPSLRGLWYRDTLEHSGSIASLEEWFDPARTRADYQPKGWNPPDTRTRAVPGHTFGLSLPDEEKKALIAFLRTL
jgi:hypothetical protein